MSFFGAFLLNFVSEACCATSFLENHLSFLNHLKQLNLV